MAIGAKRFGSGSEVLRLYLPKGGGEKDIRKVNAIGHGWADRGSLQGSAAPRPLRHTGLGVPHPLTDPAATVPPPPEAAGEDDLADLLLEVLPGDGGSLGNLSAREALAKAAGGRLARRPTRR